MANADHIEWLLKGAEYWNARREQEEFTPDFEGKDIYASFCQADKLDEEGYVPLSGMNLKHADFRKACLSAKLGTLGADLRGANLWGANLTEAKIANSRFEGACLVGARFHDAELRNSCFQGVKMASTAFVNSDLSQSDFRNTEFNNACLHGADLAYAKLEGADLASADLTDAGLFAAEPWKAGLFNSSHGVPEQHEQPVSEKHVNSIAALIEKCRAMQSSHQGCVLYFRGEGRIGDNEGIPWKLEPSLMRNVGLRANERNILLDLMSRRPEDFERAQSALSHWVLAQHHGLATRLLDVTRNPLVALFNACVEHQDEAGRVHVFPVPKPLIKPFTSDTIRVVANFSKLARVEQNVLLGISDWSQGWEIDPQGVGTYSQVMQRLYDLIRLEKPTFEQRIDPRDFFRVFVIEPEQLFARIRAQSGAFLVSAYHERFERKEILKKNSGIPIYDHYRLRIAHTKKDKIVEELRLLNVTDETLFPGLDTAAKVVMRAHQ